MEPGRSCLLQLTKPDAARISTRGKKPEKGPVYVVQFRDGNPDFLYNGWLLECRSDFRDVLDWRRARLSAVLDTFQGLGMTGPHTENIHKFVADILEPESALHRLYHANLRQEVRKINETLKVIDGIDMRQVILLTLLTSPNWQLSSGDITERIPYLFSNLMPKKTASFRDTLHQKNDFFGQLYAILDEQHECADPVFVPVERYRTAAEMREAMPYLQPERCRYRRNHMRYSELVNKTKALCVDGWEYKLPAAEEFNILAERYGHKEATEAIVKAAPIKTLPKNLVLTAKYLREQDGLEPHH
jgi:hypothetical protein